ncbi:MAG: hypothetical protein II173_04700, partial [Firmicutes bacterium]|nr:hypothetical protein [Bacillota bacterium]
MKEISSKDNRIFKQAASLQDKKHRDALGMYLIEGPSFIRDAVRYGGRLRFIFIRAGSAEALSDLEDLSEASGGPAVYSLTDELFSRLSSTEHRRSMIIWMTVVIEIGFRTPLAFGNAGSSCGQLPSTAITTIP